MLGAPISFDQIFSVVTLGQKKVVLPFMGLLLDLVVGIPTLTVVTVYSTLRFPKLWHSSERKVNFINEQFIALLVVTETFVEAHLWLEEETFYNIGISTECEKLGLIFWRAWNLARSRFGKQTNVALFSWWDETKLDGSAEERGSWHELNRMNRTGMALKLFEILPLEKCIYTLIYW